MSLFKNAETPHLVEFVTVADAVLLEWDAIAHSTLELYPVHTPFGVVYIYPEIGLCGWARRILDIETRIKLMRTWLHFSGDDIYPVGGASEFDETPNLYTNPKRKDLLQHMRDTVHKHLVQIGEM